MYDGISNKELWALHRQWEKSKKRFTCERGHQGCGCTTEVTMDGKAPCHELIEKELVWRGAGAMDE